MNDFFKRHILKHIVWIIYRSFIFSWKIKIHESPAFKEHTKKNKAFILAHWHGDELGLLFIMRTYRLATMTSTSKDGELINHVLKKLGGYTSRGSSTRGGSQALKGLIRYIRKGIPTSMAVDGPRGPIYEPKPGVFNISRMSGAPIFGLAMDSNNKWISKKSWNFAELPKPFSRVHVVISQDYIPALIKQDKPKDKLWAEKLKKIIHSTKKEATKKATC